MKTNHPARTQKHCIPRLSQVHDPLRCKTALGFGLLDLIIGLALGLSVMAMAMQAWALQRQWLNERDVREELFERTPLLQRLLVRLSRQAGSQALLWDTDHWSLASAEVALPPGIGPTWVHARDLHAQAALVPSCQNTRVWAKQAGAAPSHLRDQFAWVDGELKCKDLAQPSARWQGWVEQVRGWQAMLAWQTGSGEQMRWRWRSVEESPPQGVALGVRLCLSMDSVIPVTGRPWVASDCQGRPLADQGRAWRVWTRTFALRVAPP